jgi:hypothetical protein
MELAATVRVSALAGNPDDVVLDRHVEDGQVVESRAGDGGAVSQLETRVVPGTPDCLSDENSISERRAVMRAFTTDSKPVRLDVNQQNLLAKSVARHELTWMDAAQRHAFREIRPRQFFRLVAHYY